MESLTYTGEHLREVRFPLGGIGAGSVSLDGSARLVDWEIKNRPNKEKRVWSYMDSKLSLSVKRQLWRERYVEFKESGLT